MSPFLVGIPTGLLIGAVIAGCSTATVTPSVVGDRSVIRISSGIIDAANATGSRFYLVLRDPDTGTDYLAVQDAGIIELKPKPSPKLERAQ